MNDIRNQFGAKTTRITDARGRSVDMIDPVNQYVLRGHGDIDAQSMSRMAEEIDPGVRRKLCWVVPFIVGGGLLVTLALMALNSRTGGRLNWDEFLGRLISPAFFPVAVYMVFVFPWTIIQAKRKRKNKVFAVMLKNRRCPHCGYSLRGLSVDAMDGATICPECACAWKLDDPAIEAACGCERLCMFTKRGKRGVMTVLGVLVAVAMAVVLLLLAKSI